MATNEEIRAEAVRARGFLRGGVTQLTKVIDLIDEGESSPVDPPVEPPPPVDPPPPPSPTGLNEPAGMIPMMAADGSIAEDGNGAMGIPWLSGWQFDGGALSEHIEVVDDPRTKSGKALRCAWRGGLSPECAAASGNFPEGPSNEVYLRMELSYEPGWNIGQKLFYLRTSPDSSTDFYITRESNGSVIVYGQGGEGVIWISDVPMWGGADGFRPFEDLDTQYLIEVHVVRGVEGAPDEFHMWIDGVPVVSKTGSIGADGDWPAPFYGIEFYFDTEQGLSLANNRVGEVYISRR